MRKTPGRARWAFAAAAMFGFAAMHLVPTWADRVPSSAPDEAQAGLLVDTDPIDNAFAQINDQPVPNKDTFTIRGRVSVDAGATPVADGVANGVTVTILQTLLGRGSSAGGAFTPVDSKTFTSSQCKAVERGRSLYCKDPTDNSIFRLRRSSSPTNFRVNTIVRGRELNPGHPYGVPLAGDVLMTQAHWFGVTEANRCRVTQNGERTTCRSNGSSPPGPQPSCSVVFNPTVVTSPSDNLTIDITCSNRFAALVALKLNGVFALAQGASQCVGGSASGPASIYLSTLGAGPGDAITVGIYDPADVAYSNPICEGGFTVAAPACNSSNCNGCCDATDTCQPGNTDQACGVSGNICVDCTLGSASCVNTGTSASCGQ